MASTVAMPSEDGRPWTHSMIMDPGEPKSNSQSYKIRVTKPNTSSQKREIPTTEEQ